MKDKKPIRTAPQYLESHRPTIVFCSLINALVLWDAILDPSIPLFLIAVWMAFLTTFDIRRILRRTEVKARLDELRVYSGNFSDATLDELYVSLSKPDKAITVPDGIEIDIAAYAISDDGTTIKLRVDGCKSPTGVDVHQQCADNMFGFIQKDHADMNFRPMTREEIGTYQAEELEEENA